jgi:CRISPR-associated protein Csh1
MGDMIMPLWEVLKKKIIDNKSDENQVCDSDIEFYFAAGQLTRYLISLSQAQKMNYSIIDPILNAKDSNKVKMEIYNLIKKYSHAIDEKSMRVNPLIALVMGYNPENPSEVIYDAFIAGFASKNIIYYKEESKK